MFKVYFSLLGIFLYYIAIFIAGLPASSADTCHHFPKKVSIFGTYDILLSLRSSEYGKHINISPMNLIPSIYISLYNPPREP